MWPPMIETLSNIFVLNYRLNSLLRINFRIRGQFLFDPNLDTSVPIQLFTTRYGNNLCSLNTNGLAVSGHRRRPTR